MQTFSPASDQLLPTVAAAATYSCVHLCWSPLPACLHLSCCWFVPTWFCTLLICVHSYWSPLLAQPGLFRLVPLLVGLYLLTFVCTPALCTCAHPCLFVLVPATCLFTLVHTCPAVGWYPLSFAHTPALCACAHLCSY